MKKWNCKLELEGNGEKPLPQSKFLGLLEYFHIPVHVVSDYSKTTNYNLSMVTEQHSYLTRSATNEELSIEHIIEPV